MINNRQAGRRRGRGGGGGGNNAGPRQGRPDNGNRIDSRARGNAAQLLEKYRNLAADAQRQGDRVNTEYYLQFADHYFRVLSDQRGRFEEQPRRAHDQGRDDFDGDEEFADEGEPIRQGEQPMEMRRDRGDRDRGDRQERSDRQGRGERPERAERQDRGDRQERAERGGDRQERADRPDRGERHDRGDQVNGDAGERGREPRRTRSAPAVVAEDVADAPQVVAGQRRADPIEPAESLEARAEAVLEADAPLAPRRRGRPRRVAEAPGEPAALDADRLPPSLMTPANDAGGEDAPKPRRRRARPAASDTPDAAE